MPVGHHITSALSSNGILTKSSSDSLKTRSNHKCLKNNRGQVPLHLRLPSSVESLPLSSSSSSSPSSLLSSLSPPLTAVIPKANDHQTCHHMDIDTKCRCNGLGLGIIQTASRQANALMPAGIRLSVPDMDFIDFSSMDSPGCKSPVPDGTGYEEEMLQALLRSLPVPPSISSDLHTHKSSVDKIYPITGDSPEPIIEALSEPTSHLSELASIHVLQNIQSQKTRLEHTVQSPDPENNESSLWSQSNQRQSGTRRNTEFTYKPERERKKERMHKTQKQETSPLSPPNSPGWDLNNMNRLCRNASHNGLSTISSNLQNSYWDMPHNSSSSSLLDEIAHIKPPSVLFNSSDSRESSGDNAEVPFDIQCPQYDTPTTSRRNTDTTSVRTRVPSTQIGLCNDVIYSESEAHYDHGVSSSLARKCHFADKGNNSPIAEEIASDLGSNENDDMGLLALEMPPDSPFFARIPQKDIDEASRSIRRASTSRRRNRASLHIPLSSSTVTSDTGYGLKHSLDRYNRSSLPNGYLGMDPGRIINWQNESDCESEETTEWLGDQLPPNSPVFADDTEYTKLQEDMYGTTSISPLSIHETPIVSALPSPAHNITELGIPKSVKNELVPRMTNSKKINNCAQTELGDPENNDSVNDQRTFQIDIFSLLEKEPPADISVGTSMKTRVLVRELVSGCTEPGKIFSHVDPNDPSVLEALEEYPHILNLIKDLNNANKNLTHSQGTSRLQHPSGRHAVIGGLEFYIPTFSFIVKSPKKPVQDRKIRRIDVDKMAQIYLTTTQTMSLDNTFACGLITPTNDDYDIDDDMDLVSEFSYEDDQNMPVNIIPDIISTSSEFTANSTKPQTTRIHSSLHNLDTSLITTTCLPGYKLTDSAVVLDQICNECPTNNNDAIVYYSNFETTQQPRPYDSFPSLATHADMRSSNFSMSTPTNNNNESHSSSISSARNSISRTTPTRLRTATSINNIRTAFIEHEAQINPTPLQQLRHPKNLSKPTQHDSLAQNRSLPSPHPKISLPTPGNTPISQLPTPQSRRRSEVEALISQAHAVLDKGSQYDTPSIIYRPDTLPKAACRSRLPRASFPLTNNTRVMPPVFSYGGRALPRHSLSGIRESFSKTNRGDNISFTPPDNHTGANSFLVNPQLKLSRIPSPTLSGLRTPAPLLATLRGQHQKPNISRSAIPTPGSRLQTSFTGVKDTDSMDLHTPTGVINPSQQNISSFRTSSDKANSGPNIRNTSTHFTRRSAARSLSSSLTTVSNKTSEGVSHQPISLSRLHIPSTKLTSKLKAPSPLHTLRQVKSSSASLRSEYKRTENVAESINFSTSIRSLHGIPRSKNFSGSRRSDARNLFNKESEFLTLRPVHTPDLIPQKFDPQMVERAMTPMLKSGTRSRSNSQNTQFQNTSSSTSNGTNLIKWPGTIKAPILIKNEPTTHRFNPTLPSIPGSPYVGSEAIKKETRRGPLPAGESYTGERTQSWVSSWANLARSETGNKAFLSNMDNENAFVRDASISPSLTQLITDYQDDDMYDVPALSTASPEIQSNSEQPPSHISPLSSRESSPIINKSSSSSVFGRSRLFGKQRTKIASHSITLSLRNRSSSAIPAPPTASLSSNNDTRIPAKDIHQSSKNARNNKSTSNIPTIIKSKSLWSLKNAWTR